MLQMLKSFFCLILFVFSSSSYAAEIRLLSENPIRGEQYKLLNYWSSSYGSSAEESLRAVNNKSKLKEIRQWAFEDGLQLDGALTLEETHFDAAWLGLINSRVISIEGPIERGDLDKLKKLVESSGFSECLTGNYCPFNNTISLNSPGGSLAAALELGEYIASQNFITLIDQGNVCESACALAFLGGYTDYEGFFFARRFLHEDGKLGIHQPFFQLPEQNYSSNDVNKALSLLNVVVNKTTNFLIKSGGNLGLMERMYKTPSNEMYYLNILEASNLDVFTLGERKPVKELNRRDFLVYCANVYSAEHNSTHPELIQNLIANEKHLLTFVYGKEFICSAIKNPQNDTWMARVCTDAQSFCPLGVSQGELMTMDPEPTDQGIWDIAVYVDNSTLGDGLKEYRHRSASLRHVAFSIKKASYTGMFALHEGDLAVPMPKDFCNQIDGYHPKLMLVIQDKLNRLGINVGKPDGSAGPNTQKGIVQANKMLLARDGEYIDGAFMKALSIGGDVLEEFELC
jgi:hypothetical protein